MKALVFGVLIVAWPCSAQLAWNALPSTIEGNMVWYMDYFQQNITGDSLFTLRRNQSKTIQITDSVSMKWTVLDVWRDTLRAYFVTDTSDTANIEVRHAVVRREFVDTTKYKYDREMIDTLEYYPATKEGNAIRTQLPNDSLLVNQELFSVATMSARLRIYLSWIPLFADSLVLVKR